MPAFTDKVALTVCRSFVVLAVSRALPLYQNVRSDSLTNLLTAQQSELEMSANHVSFHVCKGDTKKINNTLHQPIRTERLTVRHNLPRSLSSVLWMKDKGKWRGVMKCLGVDRWMAGRTDGFRGGVTKGGLEWWREL